jgi:hypothetical protein
MTGGSRQISRSPVPLTLASNATEPIVNPSPAHVTRANWSGLRSGFWLSPADPETAVVQLPCGPQKEESRFSARSTKAKPILAESARAWSKRDVAAQFRLEPVEPRDPLVSHVRVGKDAPLSTGRPDHPGAPKKRRRRGLRRLRATPCAATTHDDSHPVCRRILILFVARQRGDASREILRLCAAYSYAFR